MKIDLGKITKKFYRDDEIWLKARSTQAEMNELLSCLGPFLAELHMKGYNLKIFHMDRENGVLHAALLYCCGQWKGHAVDPKLRREVIDPVFHTRTRYKRIIWEDLIQIGNAY